MNQKVLITGVTGFTGKHLVRHLRGLSENPEIIGVDCRPAECDDLDEFYEVDLVDLQAVTQLIETIGSPNYVFHLAGLLPPANEGDMWKVNVGGTQSLLQVLASKNGGTKIVVIGSAAEYKPSSATLISETEPCCGHSLYGRTKWAQTSMSLAAAREWDMNITIARTFNLIGPGLSPKLVGGALAEQFRATDSTRVELGDLSAVRDFLDIRDAVAAYWEICRKGKSGEIYNVCRGEGISIEQLVDAFIAESPKPKEIVRIQERDRSGESNRVCGDNDKLRKLGWNESISIEQSVRDMLI